LIRCSVHMPHRINWTFQWQFSSVAQEIWC
jgi:hypothetical protein